MQEMPKFHVYDLMYRNGHLSPRSGYPKGLEDKYERTELLLTFVFFRVV